MNHSTGTPYRGRKFVASGTHWHGRKEKQTFHQEHYNESKKTI